MKFEFVNNNATESGAHVKVLANDKEVGILYLNDEEIEALLDLIRRGTYDSTHEFVNSLYVDEEDYDEED